MPAPALPTTPPTVTVPPTRSPTPAARVPTSTLALSAECAAPPLPAPNGAIRSAEGCLRIHLEPQQAWEKDGFELAAAVGYQGAQPPCAAFFLTLAWQTTSGNGANLAWSVVRQGAETTLGAGAAGTLGTGCGFVRLRNRGFEPVDVDVRVAVNLVGWP